MDEKTLDATARRLAHLFFLPIEDLKMLLEKHSIKEIRQRNLFWLPFLWVCFKCVLNGKTRHRDRVGMYKNLFGLSFSLKSSSKRLSQLPPAFCQDLIEGIQPKLNLIGSPKKRKKAKDLIYKVLAEDASVFHLDNRLADIFKKIPGCKSAGLKLYANISVKNEIKLEGQIKDVRSSDTKYKSSKPKKNSIELRDRGWFSWSLFTEWMSEGRYFISRIQRRINPQVIEVKQGNPGWAKKRFQDIDLDGYTEVDFIIKPYKDSKGSVFRLKNGSVLNLQMKGRKRGDDKWYWYVFNLPETVSLTFEDVHSLYRARWRIEELFREIKQAFGGDHLRLRHYNSVVNHILMMILSYLISLGFLKKNSLGS